MSHLISLQSLEIFSITLEFCDQILGSLEMESGNTADSNGYKLYQ